MLGSYGILLVLLVQTRMLINSTYHSLSPINKELIFIELIFTFNFSKYIKDCPMLLGGLYLLTLINTFIML